MCLHTTRVRAAPETYMGLVEAGVGLIPAGGGLSKLILPVTVNCGCNTRLMLSMSADPTSIGTAEAIRSP